MHADHTHLQPRTARPAPATAALRAPVVQASARPQAAGTEARTAFVPVAR